VLIREGAGVYRDAGHAAGLSRPSYAARPAVHRLGRVVDRAAVTAILNCDNWQLVEEYVEVESGKHDHNRPALHKALEACKVYGATLVMRSSTA